MTSSASSSCGGGGLALPVAASWNRSDRKLCIAAALFVVVPCPEPHRRTGLRLGCSITQGTARRSDRASVPGALLCLLRRHGATAWSAALGRSFAAGLIN